MTETLTLYHNPGSRSDRVRKLLELAELPHRLVTVRPEDLKSPDYLAINPLGMVPTLVHGDCVIVESAAQMMYVADLVPDKGLAPPVGTPDRGIWYAWFVSSVATVEPLAMPGILDPDDPDKRARLRRAMAILTDRIHGPTCMASFTAVDVLVHWQMWFCASRGYLDRMPRALAYVEGLAPRLRWSEGRAA
ncbi:MAG: glutathione S-transferase [Myxococcota bacterium]